MNINDAIEQIKRENENPDLYIVCLFCFENYAALTGKPEDERFEEHEFPDEVLGVIEHFNIDYIDLCQKWISFGEDRE